MIFAEFKVDHNGFKFIGRDWTDASTAFVAVHDLIEHDINDSGTLEQELMALGAAIYLRTSINTFERQNACSVGNDVHHVMSNYYSNNLKPANPKDSGPLPHELADLYSITAERAMLYLYENIDQSVIDNALKWVHIGLFRAYLKYNKRVYKVRDVYRDLVRKFETFRYDEGILKVIIDLTSCTFDYEFVTETA